MPNEVNATFAGNATSGAHNVNFTVNSSTASSLANDPVYGSTPHWADSSNASPSNSLLGPVVVPPDVVSVVPPSSSPHPAATNRSTTPRPIPRSRLCLNVSLSWLDGQ